jgi:uncharacterized repeat protein (TIGR03803 family)
MAHGVRECYTALTAVMGGEPSPGLTLDSLGNLYGATYYGGKYGLGTVFKLTHGIWTEKVLHSFGNGRDGAYPGPGGLVFAGGNLYGTTGQGGAYNQGTIFEITPARPGPHPR